MQFILKKHLLPIILILFFLSTHVHAESAIINTVDDIQVHITTTQDNLTKQINNTKVGNTIFFGHYEQDTNLTNGKEPIEWILLAKDDERKIAFLISLYIIDCQRFDGFSRDVTWDNSSLRQFMNTTMLTDMFSEEEFHCMNRAYLKNQPNHFYGTYSGEDTEDYIYIPSIDDIYGCFSNPNFIGEAKWNELLRKNMARTAMATRYAIERGVRVTSKGFNVPSRGNYLLRTAGLNGHRVWYNDVYADYFISYITELGELRPDGTGINSCDDGIRPMIQVYY